MPETFDLDAMVSQLIPEEGVRYFVYDDATGQPIRAGTKVIGNPSVGIGRNLSGNGISDLESRFLCANDVMTVAATLDREIPWWRQLSPMRQRQVIDLTFNMGWAHLAQFGNFLAAMKEGNWARAVAALQASKWWGEVHGRGPAIAARILAG